MRNFLLKNTLWERYVPFLLVLTLFFIPISSSLKSIFVVLSASAILLTPSYRQALRWCLSQNWCIATLAFFLVAFIASAWSNANYPVRFLFVEKYSKLLFLPIFAIGFQNLKIRKLGTHAFLFAMVMTCFLSFYRFIVYPELSDRLFHDHISTSCMMAFAAYLSGILASQCTPKHRIFYVTLFLLFSYQVIFISNGRMGYIIFFALIILLLIQTLPWKYVFFGIGLFCLLFTICAYISPAIQLRFQETLDSVQQYKQGEEVTSVGMRLVFQHHAKSLFLSSPIIGHGTGSFSKFYQKVNTVPEYSKIMEPHSQYWLVAAESGVLGLICLFYFFISLLLCALQMKETKPLMLGLLVCLILSNISDSQLLHSDLGYFFIVFSALCLGELVASRKSNASTLELGATTPRVVT